MKAANDSFITDDPETSGSLGRAARALHVVLLGGWVFSWAAAILSLVCAIIFLLNAGGAELFVSPQAGDLEGYKALALVAGYWTLGALVVLACIYQLRHIVKTLNSGDPFVPENAQRLRILWIIIAAAELGRTLSEPVLQFFTQSALSDGTQAAGLDLTVRPHVWFFVLILIVLAQVFKEGARLRADAQLTV